MLSRVIVNLLNEDESTIMLIREYGITKLPVILLLTLAYFGLFFLLYPIITLGKVGIIVFMVAFIAILWWIVRTFIIWYLDVFIVSDQRLIDVQQEGIFSQTIKEIPYASIDDVVYSKKGIWATLLNYGTLTLTFTSGAQPLELDHVFEPKTVRDYIMQYGQEYKQESESEDEPNY